MTVANSADILQAASLYVDVAHAQLSGDQLKVEIRPDSSIDLSADPLINLERAEALIVAMKDRIKRER